MEDCANYKGEIQRNRITVEITAKTNEQAGICRDAGNER